MSSDDAVLALDRLRMEAEKAPRVILANRAFLRAYAVAIARDRHTLNIEGAEWGTDIETWKLRFSGIPIILAPSKEDDPPRAWKLWSLP